MSTGVLSKEQHHSLGVSLHQQTWALLAKEGRTQREDRWMEDCALGSLYHWRQSPRYEAIHSQRGHWLLARVYTVLRREREARHHALRCHEMTSSLELGGFDLAYSLEALARSAALSRQSHEAMRWYQKAQQAGEQISEKEDRSLFENDLQEGPWFDLFAANERSDDVVE